MVDRLIGRYEGSAPGPLVICIGAIHGNEPTGVLALREVFRLLSIEPEHNPGFEFHGQLLGFIGNLAALNAGKRFIVKDLNRMLTGENYEQSKQFHHDQLDSEDRECVELIDSMRKEIDHYRPSYTLIIDLHTTTADGGIFTIASEDEETRQLASGLFAPVILGIAENLRGTTIDFFHKPEERQFCIVFEAGRHDDPDSVHRCVAAVINCLRNIGSVKKEDVHHRHAHLLMQKSAGLPKLTRLIYHYKIPPGEKFVMKPGYENFRKISKGEVLAENQSGPILSPYDGLILMPKYQSQGDDGFFIIENLDL